MIDRFSLKTQLVTLAMSVVIIALLAAGLTLFWRDRIESRDSLQRELLSVAYLIGNRSSAALTFGDAGGAQENLSALSTHPLIGMACLVDAVNRPVATYARAGGQPLHCEWREPLRNEYIGGIGAALMVQIPVFSGEIQVGALQLISVVDPLAERRRSQLVSLGISLGLALLLVIPIALWLRRTITQPLDQVRAVANAIVDSGSYSLRVPDLGRHEVGKLGQALNAMLDTIARQNAELGASQGQLQQLNAELEQRVEHRTEELENSNRSLQEVIEQLRRAQTELVQREKLASLGALVAGVAHELNTPLGNGVVVGTTLMQEVDDLIGIVDEGKVSRIALNQSLARLQQGTNLLVRNLDRASELIRHFKQVAVDQTSENRRKFNLAEVVREIAETVQPQFKHTPHRVELDIQPDLMLDSYPGPLGQVVTNMLLNALNHAFAHVETGVVRVVGRSLPHNSVHLTVSDNGSGIAAEHLGRVFDPFFTTKLGQGGSGLGMHISYNIVTVTLGGTLQVRNEGGAVFDMVLPCVAPEPANDAGGEMAAAKGGLGGSSL
jgi:signal transduction histidine kinase